MRVLIAIGAFISLSGVALANESADQCRAYIQQNGGDDSGCDCLGAAADKDKTLAEALKKIATPADLDAADDATKAAIGACFPNAAPKK